MVPSRVIRPMRPGSSVNQTAPSGPAVIPRAKLPGEGNANSVMTPRVEIRPIRSACCSVNQSAPSGPTAISTGSAPASGTGNSVIAGGSDEPSNPTHPKKRIAPCLTGTGSCKFRAGLEDPRSVGGDAFQLRIPPPPSLDERSDAGTAGARVDIRDQELEPLQHGRDLGRSVVHPAREGNRPGRAVDAKARELGRVEARALVAV